MGSIIIKSNKELAFNPEKYSSNESIIIIPEGKHFIEHFLEKKERKSIFTAKAYRTDLLHFFNVKDVKLITLDMIRAVTIVHAERYIMCLQDKGYSPSTIYRKISSVSSLYNWLLKYKDNSRDIEIIKFNPFDKLKDEKPTLNTKETEFLTEREMKRLVASIKIDTIKGLRDKIFICLALTTALRKSEMINIRIEDIKSIGNFSIISVKRKGDKLDTVKLQPKVKELIDRYIAATNRDYIQDKADYLLISHSNNVKGKKPKLSPTAPNQILKSLCEKADINKNLTVHGLRHSSITEAIRKGLSIEKVRDFASHKNISTTNRYIHNVNKLTDYAGDSIDVF